MSVSHDKTLPRPHRRIVEEDRAWRHLYRSARDPGVAAEVVQHLRNDAEAARCHLALYLCCRQTLRAHKERIARNQRIVRLLRRISGALMSTASAGVRTLLRKDDHGSIKANSQIITPRAVQRVRNLHGRIELAQGDPPFVGQDQGIPTGTSAGPEPTNPRAVKSA
jgi:hypothetical protein